LVGLLRLPRSLPFEAHEAQFHPRYANSAAVLEQNAEVFSEY